MRIVLAVLVLLLSSAGHTCPYNSFSGLKPGGQSQAKVEDLFRGVYDLTKEKYELVQDSIDDLAARAGANPSDAALQNDYAFALFYTGKVQQSLAVYQQALKTNPNHYETLCSYATVLQFMNRLPEAAAVLKQAIALKPGFRNRAEEYHLDLINYQVLGRQNPSALKQQVVIPALTPFWQKRGNPETGFSTMDFPPEITSQGLAELVRHFPDNGDLWLALGMVLEHEGNHEYALKSYDKAVRHGNAHVSELKSYLRAYRPFAEARDRVSVGGKRILQLILGAIGLFVLYYILRFLQSIVLDITQARKAKKVLGPLGERKLEQKPSDKRKHLR